MKRCEHSDRTWSHFWRSMGLPMPLAYPVYIRSNGIVMYGRPRCCKGASIHDNAVYADTESQLRLLWCGESLFLATGGSAQMRGFATGVGSKADIGTPPLTQL